MAYPLRVHRPKGIESQAFSTQCQWFRDDTAPGDDMASPLQKCVRIYASLFVIDGARTPTGRPYGGVRINLQTIRQTRICRGVPRQGV